MEGKRLRLARGSKLVEQARMINLWSLTMTGLSSLVVRGPSRPDAKSLLHQSKGITGGMFVLMLSHQRDLARLGTDRRGRYAEG